MLCMWGKERCRMWKGSFEFVPLLALVSLKLEILSEALHVFSVHEMQSCNSRQHPPTHTDKS